jgi:hypothetical protein
MPFDAVGRGRVGAAGHCNERGARGGHAHRPVPVDGSSLPVQGRRGALTSKPLVGMTLTAG